MSDEIRREAGRAWLRGKLSGFGFGLQAMYLLGRRDGDVGFVLAMVGVVCIAVSMIFLRPKP